MKLVILLIVLKIVEGRININVDVDKNKEVVLNCSGFEKNIITDKYIHDFGIADEKLKEAVASHFQNTMPQYVYLKSPTPWGDLYKKFNWEQVSTIVQVKSAKLRSNDIKSIQILSQNFENPSSSTIKVKAGISQSVENRVSNSWKSSIDLASSQEFTYDFNVFFTQITGKTGISLTKTWGKSGEKSEAVTVGTSSGVEIELKPGQAVRAVLSATRQTLEVDIEYAITLSGKVAVKYKYEYKNNYYHSLAINTVLRAGDLETELIRTETIKAAVYVDASLKVYDKVTGKLK